MRLLPGLRRLRAIGALFLLSAWAVNPSLYLLGNLAGFHNGTSSVKASAIEAPVQGIEVCAHHQHGCPKDCLCPKTTSLAESNEETSGVPGTLYEPSLSHCSEERALIDSPPVVTAYLIPILDFSIPTLEIGPSPLPPQPALLQFPQEPPQKIPIA